MAQADNFVHLQTTFVVDSIKNDESMYKDYLASAAWMFKYSLNDSLLIYIQAPRAIAVAGLNIWERPQFGRSVKKDSFAIILPANKDFKKLYDVSDTIAVTEKTPFHLWEITAENSPIIEKELKDLEKELLHGAQDYSDCINTLIDARLDEAIQDNIAAYLELENETEDTFQEKYVFLRSSTAYVVSERMGFDKSGIEIPFDSVDVSEEGFVSLLSIIKTASANVLREIAPIAAKYTPIPEKAKIKKEDYHETEHNLLQTRGQDFRSDSRGTEVTVRKIWTDEEELSDAERSEVYNSSPEGEPGRSSDGSRSEGEGDGRADNQESADSISGTTEGSEPGMGEPHEEPAEDGRGESSSRAALSVDKINYLLYKEDYLTHSNSEIDDHMAMENTSLEEKIAFLQSSYDDAYNSFFYLGDPENGYVGYKKQDDGLFFWEGNYLTRTVEHFISWEDVVNARRERLGLPRDLDISKPTASPEVSPESSPELAVAPETAPETPEITEEDIAAELRGGSGFAQGKFRIYDRYKSGANHKYFADFLKNEYGIGGHGGPNMLSQNHDSKGMSLENKSGYKITMSWSEVAKRIGTLIEDEKYLSEEELLLYPVFLNDRNVKTLTSKLREYGPYNIQYNIPFSSFNDLQTLCESSIGKFLFERAVENRIREYEGNPEELRALLSELKQLNPISLDSSNRSWSQLDWQLEREVENSVESALDIKVGDIITITPKEYLVTEIEDDNYIIQDIDFPLLTVAKTEAEIREMIAQDDINNKYLVASEEIEIDHSIYGRAERLVNYLAPRVNGLYSFSEDGNTILNIYKDDTEVILYPYKNNAIDSDLLDVIEKASDLDRIFFVYDLANNIAESDITAELSLQSKLPEAKGLGIKLSSATVAATHKAKEQAVEIEAEPEVEEKSEAQNEPDVSNGIEDTKDSAPVTPVQYTINPDNFSFGGPKQRYKDNVAAIKLLKTLENENRKATAEEQDILFRYVGWGGLSNAFDKNDAGWASEYQELKELLTDEEYKSARESTLTAYYTPPAVIKGVYDALRNMGFTNGNILDPCTGTGNFIGMLPEDMEKSNIYAVEIDSLSGRIAKQLYQKSSIEINGFENSRMPDQFFDAVIGNVPFGQFTVNDDAYKKENFLIHDYFFAKALDKVRTGGVIAFVTSKGTLDKQNSEVREYIAKRADLLGAVRLPNDIFTKNAGTTVTSDIIFLQKRDRLRQEMPSWTETGINEDGFEINNYFIEHPEMIVGKLSMEKGQFGREDVACIPGEIPFEKAFEEAISKVEGEFEAYEYNFEDEESSLSEESLPADPSYPNFSYQIIDDKLYMRRYSRMEPVETNEKAMERIRALIPLRDKLKELIAAQLTDVSDEDLQPLQAELNDLYDTFIKEYDYINKRGNSIAFSEDPSYYLLCTLEKFDDEGKYLGKADIFNKRTVRNRKAIEAPENSIDALAISIGEKGRIDIDYMEELLKDKNASEIIDDLTGVIFEDPEKPDVFYTADEYLSGNVKKKLAIAREAAKENPRLNANVEALTAVQPEPLEAVDIAVRLGATWVPEEIYTDFYHEVFEVSDWAKDKNSWGYSRVVRSDEADSWIIENKDSGISHVISTSVYGTSRRGAAQIFEDAMNLRESKVYDYIEEDGKRKAVLNKTETMLAQEKQEQIKEKFAEWVWKDINRRELLVGIYNDKFNSMRAREYDGSNLLFHGMNSDITLREHQLTAVARGIYGGNSLLDHPVGSGKTWEMVAIAMEGNRLGISSKTMFVVPKHLIRQWASDFLELYPTANILVAKEKDFTPANRKKFCARIATGNYDAIIIGHSQFEKIPLSPEREQMYNEQELERIITALESAKDDSARLTVKALERKRKAVEKRLDALNDVDRDDVITFEELGIDRLFIDEFHFFKNLSFDTKMGNISGIAATGAKKTQDLFNKVQYLNEITDFKGLIGATGTPITNSMAELYSLQRYFTPQVLDEKGLSSFDSWASTFGEVVTSVELAPEGTNYRTKQRFAKFYNVPELMMLYHDFADVKTPDMINLPVPKAKFENIAVPASDVQKDLLQDLVKRADKVRNKEVDSSVDNMLLITNDGRKLALDARLLDPSAGDFEGSKVNACVDNVYKIYNETSKDRLTQLVFCDLSTPAGSSKPTTKQASLDFVPESADFSNVYDDIKAKLIAKGVPADEIAFIHDAGTATAKEKLFSKVRNGKVRVLLGSTSMMGVGTNVQDRVIAMHDLDCPWRPSDLEQRLGRGIRQGNKNKEVSVFRYITEGTFDAYLYQLVEQKQRFISQIRNGSVNVRSAEDIDESTLAYAEIKALASGNPLIKEKMDLDIQVHKLNILKTNYLRSHHSLEEKVTKTFPAAIADCNIRIANIDKDLALLGETEGKRFEITVGNIPYNDKKEAAEAISDALKVKSFAQQRTIGSFRGLDIIMTYSYIEQAYSLTLKGNHTYNIGTYKSGSRILERLDEVVNNIPGFKDNYIRKLEQTEKDVINAEKELKKPFDKAAELEEKTARLNELNILMNVEGGAAKEDVIKDAKNPLTAPELLGKLRDHDSPEVRAAIAGNPSMAVEDLIELKNDIDQDVRITAALNSNMPGDLVKEFCRNASNEDMIAMTSSEYIREEVIEEALSRGDFEYNLVSNSKLSSEMIDMLARKITGKYNLSTLSGRKNCLPETLEYIASRIDRNDWYRAGLIVQNANCPASVLMKFSGIKECHLTIALNPNVTVEILDKILESPNRLYIDEIRNKRDELDQLEENEQAIISKIGSALDDIISEGQKESVVSVSEEKAEEYFEEDIER